MPAFMDTGMRGRPDPRLLQDQARADAARASEMKRAPAMPGNAPLQPGMPPVGGGRPNPLMLQQRQALAAQPGGAPPGAPAGGVPGGGGAFSSSLYGKPPAPRAPVAPWSGQMQGFRAPRMAGGPPGMGAKPMPGRYPQFGAMTKAPMGIAGGFGFAEGGPADER
jgi:hypothetical protein